jgi:hypothetical protein
VKYLALHGLESHATEVKNVRSRQDSNLRGETPLDFKSNALTTRPRLPDVMTIIQYL